MDARLAKVREALEAFGAYPATVDELSGELDKWIADRVASDARDREAVQALLSGIDAATTTCKCHRSTVYRRNARARRKSHFRQPDATETV